MKKTLIFLIIAIVLVTLGLAIFGKKPTTQVPNKVPVTPDVVDPCKANPKLQGCEKGA